MEAAIATKAAASPLVVSIGDTASLPSAKSPDTGQMRSSSPFTPNSFPTHKTTSLMSTSSPPAATTAGSPLQNETHLSPSKEPLVTDQLQPAASAAIHENVDSPASSLSDVETFNGKIVYNPDGSAYIIEGPDSDGSEVEAEISQEGSIIDARGLSPHYGSISFPQIVSAFHILRSSTSADLYSALCGQAALAPQNSSNEASKVPEVPVMHSYRVFSLRNKKEEHGEEECGLDGATEEEEEDEEDAKLRAINCSTVPVKPILMCFICKLSFGYSKSFVAHAIGEHHLSLNEEETRVLSAKNTSAIIQGVGKEKEPLLSFLKPNSSPAPFTSGPSQSCQQQQIDAQRLLAVQMAAVASALRSSSLPPSSTATIPDSISPAPCVPLLSSPKLAPPCNATTEEQTQATPNASESQAGNDVPSTSSSFSSSSFGKSSDHNNKSGSSSRSSSSSDHGHLLDMSSPLDSSGSAVANKQSTTQAEASSQFASELADLANLEKFAKAAAVAAQQQMDLQSIAAAMAAAVAASSSASTGQLRTPSPGSKNSPKSPAVSAQSVLLSGQLSNAASTFGAAINSAAVSLMSNDAKAAMSIFSTAADSETPTLLATTIANHVTRPTMTTGSHPPLLMQHSRNSCKTLKCPKCNWHYKYQETLEIHMKEKHPENEMNCIYCLTNQPHPRLARGETYTCGYKPYRCDVCNYSTTTKGNLSIHMQSDKHINNVQELQNGNIPATAEHLLQSQALAAAVAQCSAAAAAAANGTGQSNPSAVVTTTSGAMVSGGSTSVVSPASTPAVNLAAMAVAAAAQQDAKNHQLQKMQSPQVSTQVTSTVATTISSPSSSNSANGKQKATWRCDVCNYETNVARNLRIHMTSEKHTHNIMVLRQNVNQMQQISALQQAGIITPEQLLQFNPGLLAAAAAAAAGMNGQANVTENGGGSGSLQPEAALADMAYNHALLMMASQQHQQRAMAAMLQQQQQMTLPESKSPLTAAPMMMMANGSQPTFDMEHPDPSLSGVAPCDDSCRMFHCCVCATFTSDSIETLSQHIQCDRTRTREDEVLASVGGSYICKLCSYKTNLKANFQLHCKTDKHLQRLQHINHIKEGGHQAEWKLKFVNVSNPVQVRCNVCDYYTNSIHKLQLHTANPRHDVRSRVFSHLQAASSELATTSNKCYYQCSLCNSSTRTKFALIQHINSVKHVRNDSLHQLKQQTTGGSVGVRDSEEEIREMFLIKELLPGEKVVFENDDEAHLSGMGSSQPLAGVTLESSDPALLFKNALLDHSASAQLEAKLSIAVAESAGDQQSSPVSCPFCSFSTSSEMRMQMHILTSHHHQATGDQQAAAAAVASALGCAPSILCPLCQEAFQEKARLENHLVRIHNVNEEGVQRLILLVDTTELDKFLVAKQQKVQNDSSARRDAVASQEGDEEDDGRRSVSSGDSGSKLAEDELIEAGKFLAGSNASGAFFEYLLCPACNQMHLSLEDLFSHMTGEGHIKPIVGGQFQCWRSGCGQTFKSVAATQQHFKEQHFLKCIKLTNSSANLASNAPVSDRHVYKYRCSQCSLAFKTYEKLELHMQYHLIRAATQCVICGRSFRSVEALQKHVESSHSDMSEEELEQYKTSLVSNQLLFAFGRNGGILDPSTTQLLKKESVRSDGAEDESMETEDDALLDNQANDDGLQPIDDNSADNVMNNCAMNGNASENSFEDYLNSQSLAEDNYNDPSRKFKCHRCKVAFTRQSYLTSHNKTLLHRKGEKMSYPMEKYLDPNRPFKCEICKESFTQKNILLVHYNSVSHLHKLKQSMKESSAAVAAAAAASSGNEPSLEAQTGDVEGNRVFRCNLCKVSYAQASAFNNHLQSFAHKSRDSKFQELAISGQLDLSLPLIEHPETLQEANNNNPSKANANEQLSNKQQHQASTPSASPSPSSKLPDMLANLTEQQQQALAFQQAALNFALAAGQSGSGQSQLLQLASSHHQSPFTCGKCGAAFISQDAQLQHQQLCGLFGNQLQAIANSAQNNSSQARQIKLPNFQAPICKSKPQLYKHLLETWGFEIVMQFNESHQKKKKLATDVKVEEEVEEVDLLPATVEKPEVKTELESETTAVEEDNAVPEINRCQCDICSKEFSSIWVLKAHREEIHKDVLPLDVVESFADEYRTEYERKFSNGNDDEAGASESNEQPSGSHAISNGMDRSVGGSGSNGNNASHTLSANSSPVDDGSPISESAASMPPNANPTSPEAQNFGQFGLPNLPPNASPAEIAAANQMAAAQLQFGQLLMSMGLAGMAGMPMPGGMNMPFAAAAAMGIPPQLIPMMMADPMMAAAAAFNNPALAAAAAAQMNAAAQAPTSSSTPGTASPAPSNTTMSNVQPPVTPSQMNSQAAAVAAAAAAQQKRARTRISDEQLKVLRQYFDINNSPTEEQLIEMSQKSGLPMKVIKHWFRNTLFKERQRNKDSPYNFNNPPSTYLNLDEYEKTGEAKVFNLDDIKIEEGTSVVSPPVLESDKPEIKPSIKDKPTESESESESKNCSNDFKSSSSAKDTDYTTSDDEEMKRGRESKDNMLANVQANSNDLAVHLQKQQQVHIQTQLQQQTDFDQLAKVMSLNVHSPQHSESSMSSNSESTVTTNTTTTSSLFAGLSNFGPGLSGAPNMTSSPLQFALDAAQRSQLAAAAAAAVSPGMLSNAGHSVSSHSSSGKRANRTRFTDYQIKVLQEFFESNAYPKDDDLEYLSKLLNLSPRVIVVWFQNARQKARKVYENQPASTPIETPDDGSGRFQRTPGLNYQCKKCLQVFQRYYELIKHQKSSCFKDENPLAAQIRMAAERAQATSPSLSATRETSTPIDCSRSATATPEKVQTTNMLASPGSVSTASPAPSSTCSNHKSSPTSNAMGAAAESQAYRCDKCTMSFNRYDQWKEHQIVHQLVQNSSLFNSPSGNPFALIGQLDGAGQVAASHLPSSPQPLNISPSSIFPQGIKRKMTTTTTAPTTDDDDDESHDSMSGNGGSNSGDPTPRDKRLRTTILPEQLDYLYQKYQVESNPSRKMLESIAKEVGLKKRVVQVWFQNTRARERKGQFRAHQQVIHKRCPFCRALFKARSALESHLATRHADQYTKGDINIDALPDGDPSEDGDSSVNEPIDPRNMDNSQVADMMRQYYASCMGDLNMQGKDGGGLPAELAMKMKTALEQAVVASAQQQHSATTSNAIDLTPQTPLQTTATVTGAFASIRQYSNGGGIEDEGFDDTRSEEFDSEAEEEIDFDYSQSPNPSSPSASNGFGHGASHSATSGNSHRGIVNSNSKRFRTQMTTVMLKVMKSIFADYKTPTMAECEALGREIGLAKRVVQVWFQNARAKEKKARLQFAKTFGHELDASTPAIEECKICVIKYSKHAPNAMQEHLFTSGHIAKLKHHINNMKKMIEGQDDNSADFPVASGHPIPPTMLVNPHSTTNIFTGNGDPKKAVTFMQQLQLIQGLAAASQGSPALPMGLGELLLNGVGGDVNGDASKKSFDHDGQDNHNDFFNSRDAHDSGPSFAPFMFGTER